nr:hypothetical protein [Tanacetum cinerariifolium]
MMTTLVEHIIVASAENYHPMLEKSMYDSWASHICLFIKGKKNSRMMLDLIDEAFQTEYLEAYDSDCDDKSLAKAVLMANLLSCDSDVLSENLFHLKKDQRIRPTLYYGSVIAKEHDVISVIDDQETLILKEESQSKMLDKQNDPISIKQKINISSIDYSNLNKIKKILMNFSLLKKNYLQNKQSG